MQVRGVRGRQEARGGLAGFLRARARAATLVLAVSLVLAAALFAAALAAGVAAAAEEIPAELPAPGLTLTASPAKVRAGSATTLTAHLDAPGAALVLSRRLPGEPEFTPIRTATADAGGSAAWLFRPSRNTVYRVEFKGDATWAAAAAEAEVGVKPRLPLSATSSVYEGQRVVFTAQAIPAHPGATVTLERLVEGVWTPWRTLTLDAQSKAVYRWASAGRGTHSFRVAMAADADHVAAVGAARDVLVRNPNPYGVPAGYARFIVVDKSQYKLYYHERGRIVRVFKCVLGKPSTPTPLGRFKIYAMDPDMWGAYGPRRMRYWGLYAIHGTNEPWLLDRFPRNYSHGCTRLANSDILWLFARCRVGTPIWNVR